MDCVCTTTLTLETNPISPDEEIRKAAVAAMKKCVDICNTLGAPILGGVNYAGWGYLTKKPRTDQEWDWGVACMREVAEYAKRDRRCDHLCRMCQPFRNTLLKYCRRCSEVL